MTYITATTDEVISLGRQGENEVVTVQFDVGDWIEEYGEGTFTLVHQRCRDGDGYEREITIDDGVIDWVITNVDVAYAGRGMLQLTYTVGDAVAKSEFYYTKVLPSLDADEDVPDPWQPWVDTLAEYRDDAVDSAESASASAEAASGSAEDAEGSAEDAEAWAVGKRSGVDVGSDDETYHNNSKYYSEQAGSSASSAYTYATNASDSASDAAQSALEASSFVGAPLVASTAAGMTDTTRVYVYTGAESGYTSGNWYYWNGTAWTSGGVYNSAAVDVATTADIDTALYS